MIADKRSWQFVDQFTDQWLDVGALQRVAVTPDYYPKFDNLSINGDVSAVPEPSSRASDFLPLSVDVVARDIKPGIPPSESTSLFKGSISRSPLFA